MGLTESFQLCSLVFGFLKLFCLTVVLYLIALHNGWMWSDETMHLTDYIFVKYSVPAIFLILLVMIFSDLMIAGILKKNLRLLRICKVYNIVEKSTIIFLLLVTAVLMSSVYRVNIRWHFVSYEEATEDVLSVKMQFLTISILMTALYMLFQNWMINGTIASVKRDLNSLNRDKSVMLNHSSP